MDQYIFGPLEEVMDKLKQAIAPKGDPTEKQLEPDKSCSGNTMIIMLQKSPKNGDCSMRGRERKLLNNRSPPEWPPLLRVPAPEYRAVRTDFSHRDLLSKSCKVSGACPATILITGKNSSLGHGVSENMFKNTVDQNFSSNVYSLANTVLGTESHSKLTNFLLELVFFSNSLGYVTAGSSLVGEQGSLLFGIGNLSPDAVVFDVEYARWLEEHHRLMFELRAATQEHMGENELRLYY
ncbi:hypothetical protein POM88_026277 [Heracleum sosnowskyi]|uniref:Uncharacterized protein n=1 Tax=Heracleum sosnowskyi TaxID=360622 RepID=A0AAD8MPU1_9APIA|nr:hypothetical protein POM88_026277 [Heracleum sosnowskyi]